jgi:hypothetical protein
MGTKTFRIGEENTAMSNTETAIPQGYELKKKKPIFKKVWFWLLVIVAVIIIATVANSGDGETASAPGTATNAPADGSAAPAEAPADDPLSDGGWTASDIQVERTQFGDSITARVTNTEVQAQTGVFTLTIFGPDGARIGETMGSANDVEPGQTATVTFVGTSSTDSLPGDPATYTYEFQNDL